MITVTIKHLFFFSLLYQYLINPLVMSLRLHLLEHFQWCTKHLFSTSFIPSVFIYHYCIPLTFVFVCVLLCLSMLWYFLFSLSPHSQPAVADGCPSLSVGQGGDLFLSFWQSSWYLMSMRPPIISRTKNFVWFFIICRFPSIVLNVPGITCPIFRMLAWHILFESICYSLLLYRKSCVHVCGYVHACLRVGVCVHLTKGHVRELSYLY